MATDSRLSEQNREPLWGNFLCKSIKVYRYCVLSFESFSLKRKRIQNFERLSLFQQQQAFGKEFDQQAFKENSSRIDKCLQIKFSGISEKETHLNHGKILRYC